MEIFMTRFLVVAVLASACLPALLAQRMTAGSSNPGQYGGAQYPSYQSGGQRPSSGWQSQYGGAQSPDYQSGGQLSSAGWQSQYGGAQSPDYQSGAQRPSSGWQSQYGGAQSPDYQSGAGGPSKYGTQQGPTRYLNVPSHGGLYVGFALKTRGQSGSSSTHETVGMVNDYGRSIFEDMGRGNGVMKVLYRGQNGFSEETYHSFLDDDNAELKAYFRGVRSGGLSMSGAHSGSQYGTDYGQPGL